MTASGLLLASALRVSNGRKQPLGVHNGNKPRRPGERDVSTTRIVTLDDGAPVLETFDFRSEFAFDDFASWIAERLNIHPTSGEIGEDMEPFSFQWGGSTSEAGWSDEHGCFITATADLKDQLQMIQSALSS
ncbi:MAG: hypothetical protein WC729_05455 [Sphingomonas sp.]|jgi:hypothetical protein|uniref:hypothetical protein n=1 Tax=Sphingomonas sp. TaxID=28214 RepID=UPI003569F773